MLWAAKKKSAGKIVNDCKADYVLNVKSNQEGLLNDIVAGFQTLKDEKNREFKRYIFTTKEYW